MIECVLGDCFSVFRVGWEVLLGGCFVFVLGYLWFCYFWSGIYLGVDRVELFCLRSIYNWGGGDGGVC